MKDGSGRVMDTLTSNLLSQDSLRNVLVYQGLTQAVTNAPWSRSKESLSILRQVDLVALWEFDERTEVSGQSVSLEGASDIGCRHETVSTH
jgi:hypothetical protein